MVTLCILGILSTITLINLSQTWNKERLKATARGIENWLSQQRLQAMQYGLTCEVLIDVEKKTLTGQVAFSSSEQEPKKACNLASAPQTFEIAEEFQSGAENVSVSFSPAVADSSSSAGILLSFRGFSENKNLAGNEQLELRLKHKNVAMDRCIKIVSPIGLIRDGYASNPSSGCRYDRPY